ncbi:hypothetical protein [Oceanispirochaeta sp.]|jgi:hypothetical protein|uniref:hypothetical protein n=1 Tax=Oceanispirochaeta sp. TaxID=2035350 RepID=UPI002611ECC6|nr:hypothetical protein [Oceanispirochaeta sp.]MDA3956121.1 hypothetical protein [Oceanispirochaeta sp.]
MKRFLLIPLILQLSGVALFAETTKTIIIENNLDNPLYYLYLSPVSEREWGDDRLGDGLLDPGTTIEIDFDYDEGKPLFNLMAEDEMEKAYKIEEINMNEINFISISPEDFLPFGGFNPVRRDLTFTNNTGEAIYYLYVSSHDSMYWGEDLLGDEILYDSSSITLEVPVDGDYPNNDIMAESESNSSYELPNQNMLENDNFTFTEDEMTSSGEDYDYEDYDDYDAESDDYLEGYRDGFKEAWKEAYSQGFNDAMEE